MLDAARACHDEGVAVAVFPELCLSGYAIDDLLLQDALLDAVERGVATLAAGTPACCRCCWWARRCATPGGSTTARWRSTAAACWAWCPRASCPTTASSTSAGTSPPARRAGRGHRAGGARVPFGTGLLFAADDLPGLVVHAEICEDLWVPVPPSGTAALAGATVLANLSASNITVGKADTRDLLCRRQSARCLAAYVYAAAGAGESTTDLAWDGQASIFENGAVLAESARFPEGAQRAVADVDLDLLRQERARQGTFDDNRRPSRARARPAFRTVDPLPARPAGRRSRAAPPVERFPFVPADPARLQQDCYEAYTSRSPGWSSGCAPPGCGAW